MADVLIKQGDVFVNPSLRSRAAVPYVLTLQSDTLATTSTVVVAPLLRGRIPDRTGVLYPVFDVRGREVTMSTSELATMPRRVLVNRVASLAPHRDAVIRALDLLFTGI